MQAVPVISVITVCYNSAATLAGTLQSVSEQDWQHVEHLVIDGGSTDGTVDIIERFREKLAHVVSEKDKGIYDAMNKGLKLASGDIVCFLNADDVYAHTMVLSEVAGHMRDHDLDALVGDVGYFREEKPARIVRRYRSNRFSPDRLAWGWMPAHPALFLRRSVVQRVGLFNTDYRIAGDYEFIVRAFYGHKLMYRHLPKVLVHMRLGGVSTGGWRNTLLLNQEVLRACRENGIPTNVLKLWSKYPLKLLEFLYK